MSWVLLSYQDVIPKNKKNQSLPISLNELGPGWNILEHASRRQPHHLILGSYPSPNPCDMLGPIVQAKHIGDRLGAWHVAKAGAGSPTLVQTLLDWGGEAVCPVDERITEHSTYTQWNVALPSKGSTFRHTPWQGQTLKTQCRLK